MDSKLCTRCNLVKSSLEFSPDPKLKSGLKSACKKCMNIYYRSYRSKNLDKEKLRADRYLGKPEKKEKKNARNREYIKIWRLNNPGRANSINRNRELRKVNATPNWANLAEISKIYIECSKLSLETGKKYHVDHLIPLRGKNVCGLHVEYNLRIIPASENITKSNKLLDL